jgi:hypothetical protein
MEGLLLCLREREKSGERKIYSLFPAKSIPFHNTFSLFAAPLSLSQHSFPLSLSSPMMLKVFPHLYKIEREKRREADEREKI